MANTIQLKGEFRLDEGLASGVVKPGMLLERTSATTHTVIAHSVQGGVAERAFAMEDALQGKTVDDAYADGDLVTYHLAVPGAEMLALIKAGSVLSVGEQLISGGDGTLIPIGDVDSGYGTNVIAIAVEALDLSDSDLDDTLSPVRVL